MRFSAILGVKMPSAAGQGDRPEGPEPGRAQLRAGQLHVHPLPRGPHSCRPRSGTTSGYSSFPVAPVVLAFRPVRSLQSFQVIPIYSLNIIGAANSLQHIAHSLEHRLIIMLN